MKGYMLGMLAETPIHPGAGQVYSVIDLPVARERTTHYPMIPGSSLKGALRDKLEEEMTGQDHRLKQLFGKQDQAGAFSVTDARLLLLPVRSLTGHYRWVTCPYLLQRLCRDLQLIGVCDKQKIPFPLDFFGLQKEEAIVEDTGESTIFLEELSFNVKVEPEIIGQLIPFLTSLIRHEFMQSDVVKRLTIIHDEEFAHFARYGLPVMSRNKLEDETKKSENLWQEETIPPDSLFYTLLIARNGKEEVIEELADHLKENVYLQVGGNETVGQGWMVTKLMGRVG